MKLKKLVGNFVSTFGTSVAKSDINTSSISGLVLSKESMDEVARSSAIASKANLEDVVKQSIQLATESATEADLRKIFSPGQVDAAIKIAALALDPAGYTAKMSNLESSGGNGTLLSSESAGIQDIIDATTLSTESFDSQDLNNALQQSVALNLFASRQDEFGETFFPTIVIDPTKSGITVTTELVRLYTDFQRSTSGTPDRSKFNKVNLAKAVYDNSIFGIDRNRAIPVSRADNASVLNTALEHIDTSTGTDIVTAPIKVGEEVSLLGISQTDAMLAAGTADTTDALDQTVRLDKVYAKLTSTDANGAVTTEYLGLDVSLLPGSNYTYSTQGHNKDLILNFSSTGIVINTSSTLATTGGTTAASTILGALPPGYTIKLNLKLSGEGNTQYGDIALYANALSIYEIYDASGNRVSTSSADYATISAALANLTIDSYDVIAYRTNSNLRTRGQLVTADTETIIYDVPLRSGITVIAPVSNINGAGGDTGLIGQIQTTGFRMSSDAVRSLINFDGGLTQVVKDGVTSTAVIGIGSYHVNPYRSELSLDLTTLVDSESSSERADDICYYSF